MNAPYDPKLKEAMLEIQEILDKHKIGGNIALTSQSHSEFLYHFPEWSVIQFDKNKPGEVRIRSKREDFKSKEEQHQMTRYSTHIVAQNRDLAGRSFEVFDTLFKELEKYFDIEHKPFHGFTPYFEN
jgi:hypothetical protein